MVMEDDEQWVVFADVCKTLGYKNANHESKKIPFEEKRRLEIGLKNTLAVCVNERGLLYFSWFSNKENAREFYEWARREIFKVVR